jgi:hypothetical protein
LFFHLGEDVIILKKTVIGIFDKEICTNSISTREFLEIYESEKKINKIGDPKKVKSFILTNEGLYLSPISSNTLLKRFEQISEF